MQNRRSGRSWRSDFSTANSTAALMIEPIPIVGMWLAQVRTLVAMTPPLESAANLECETHLMGNKFLGFL
jgi:hypothetical protein